ncbi:SDR family NAD(P)-dependent oxidoreductase [Paenibacillus qinlingensis]|uniref:NAD(P)-dependent dehydrogenase (Short-subunit alcohol dehydrogenase family) n=1 Tax=Paenibacillus qinlingensis TaxID=1837343 RepID=A0ABU1P0C1_9BACL|nr:SDR family NAD(P)-dependent oxidoreductase [Paenibacillus qinlingensis]MDR6553186.1 NAD(P)-dependent dehydrogenase (short-subunit alcohol dehydrogenase family) [Paenibacillus qinlingensis]
MSLPLQDKVIVVTGALGKIGFAAVRMFLARGAKVIANDWVTAEESPRMMELQAQYGPDRLLFVQADASNEDQVTGMFRQIREQFGRLEGSFHNSYTQNRKPVAEYTLEDWNGVIQGTLTSTFLISKHAILLMQESGGGSIVNTSSVLGVQPRAGEGAYGSSKAGINFLTQVIAAENAVHGIRANVIIPGDVKEPKPVSPAKAEELRKSTWLGRSGTPDEICELASFLLSDAASYITGSLYTIDGGIRI